MEFFVFFALFWITMGFFLGRASKKSSDQLDYQSLSYRKGYWDGWRALVLRMQKFARSHQNVHDLKSKLHDEIEATRVLSQAPELNDLTEEQPAQQYDPEAPQPAQQSTMQQTVHAPESAEQKQAHETRNINITLYVASFLLVAAGLLFITTSLPDSVKLVAILLVTVLFYALGLVLHATTVRLKPAAIAFVGTGLALLPFAGLALYNFGGLVGDVAWFVTSIVGLIAYLVAAVRLQSQLVAYLTMAFVFSMTMSSVAVIDAPLVYYFVLLIAISLIASVLSHFKKNLVPKLFALPIEQTGQILTPIVLLAGLILPDSLTYTDYEIIYGVALAHYAVVYLQTKKYIYEIAMRLLFVALFIVLGLDVTNNNWQHFGWWVVSIGFAQWLYSIISVFVRPAKLNREHAWLVGSLFLMLSANSFWTFGAEFGSSWITITLSIIAVLASVSVFATRQAAYGYFVLFSSLCLPFIIGYELIKPSLPEMALMTIFLALSIVTIGLRKYFESRRLAVRVLLSVSYFSYLFAASCLMLTLSHGGIATGALVITIIFVASSYIEKQAFLLSFASLFLTTAIYQLLQTSTITTSALPLATASITGLILYAFSWLFFGLKDSGRRRTLLISFWVVTGLAILGNIFSETYGIAASLLLCVVATTVAIEGYLKKRLAFYEIGLVLVTIALQRILSLNIENVDFLVYTHWWALVVASLAYIRLKTNRKLAVMRGIIALSIVSFFTGIQALGGSDGVQILFLLEHAALLAAGLIFQKKLLVTWSAVGIALSVLWMLRGYTFILVALVGISLIGLAIWRLVRKDSK